MHVVSPDNLPSSKVIEPKDGFAFVAQQDIFLTLIHKLLLDTLYRVSDRAYST